MIKCLLKLCLSGTISSDVISVKAPLFTWRWWQAPIYCCSEEKKSKAKIHSHFLQKKDLLSRTKKLLFFLSTPKSVDYESLNLCLIDKDKLNGETCVIYQRELWLKLNFRSFFHEEKTWINSSMEWKQLLSVISLLDMEIGVRVPKCETLCQQLSEE